MKSCTLVFFAILCTGCSNLISPPSLDQPILLTFIDATEFDVQLLLTNNSPNSVVYFGFSKSSPLKTVEILSDTGWSVVVWDWCGTGAERQEVKPNESAIILAPIIRKHVKTRVAFGYRSAENSEFTKLVSSEYIIR